MIIINNYRTIRMEQAAFLVVNEECMNNNNNNNNNIQIYLTSVMLHTELKNKI